MRIYIQIIGEQKNTTSDIVVMFITIRKVGVGYDGKPCTLLRKLYHPHSPIKNNVFRLQTSVLIRQQRQS